MCPSFLAMNERNSLAARVAIINRTLDEVSSLVYYQQPIPSTYDFFLDETVRSMISARVEQRAEFQALLTKHCRSMFGIYGHRAATRAARDNRSGLLQLGIAAAVFANYVLPDNRRLEVSLAVYHYVAQKLDLEPAALFSAASDLAAPDLAAKFAAFGHRDDLVLSQYGWKEIDTPDGIRFKFSWG